MAWHNQATLANGHTVQIAKKISHNAIFLLNAKSLRYFVLVYTVESRDLWQKLKSFPLKMVILGDKSKFTQLMIAVNKFYAWDKSHDLTINWTRLDQM